MSRKIYVVYLQYRRVRGNCEQTGTAELPIAQARAPAVRSKSWLVSSLGAVVVETVRP